MKTGLSFFIGIIGLAIAICIVGWVFSTGFLIFEIILGLLWIGLKIGIVLAFVIGVLWVLNDLFV